MTLIEEQPKILPYEDPEIVRWLARRLSQDAVTIRTGTIVRELQTTPTGVSATLADGSAVTAERCLIAIGQRPIEAL